MVDFIKVGKKISYYRRQLSMTQDELADKLFVTRQALSKWENGSGVPSIDTVISLSKIFDVSFEDILCLNDDNDVNRDNIFSGHERKYIIGKLLHNELNVELSDIFYQLSSEERFIILRSIKDHKLKVNDMNELYVKLTISEQKYLGDIRNGNF